VTDADRREEIGSNWQRACDSLEAACVLCEKGYADFAASRAYYAAFYAATALLLAENKDFAKHTGVVAAVHKEFVRTGGLAQEHGRTLSWLFELRGIADYGELRHVPEPEARKAIEAADAFVKACGALLHKRGLRPPT
jgi:uncharacterized protein (UPF0332 family)